MITGLFLRPVTFDSYIQVKDGVSVRYTERRGHATAVQWLLLNETDKQRDKAPRGAKDYIVDGKMTGGFAILAYPTACRNSGILTFIVSKDGTV